MEKIDKIQLAIRRWNPWWLQNWEKNNYIPRTIFKNFQRISNLRHIKDVIGVRRCGKTSFLQEIIFNFINKKRISPQKIVLINFDDFILRNTPFDEILKAIKQFPISITHLILDEIQEKSGWQSWIRTLYDTNLFENIIMTGSNASLLSSDINKILSGRHISLILTPFSFVEFLNANGFDISKKISINEINGNLDYFQKMLIKYFKVGGFPEAVLAKSEYERNMILLTLANDIIFRDIVSRYSIEQDKMRLLFQYIMTNFTHEYSLRKIGNLVNLHPETVKKYLVYLKEAFVIGELSLFSYKLSKQYHEKKKIYVIDSGLRNAVSFYDMGEKGKFAENLVFWELYRREYEFYYWKNDKHEVDFVVTNGMKVKQLIQVCWALSFEKTRKREKDGLVAAAKEYSLNEGYIFTADEHFDEEYCGITIHVVRLVEWLLL